MDHLGRRAAKEVARTLRDLFPQMSGDVDFEAVGMEVVERVTIYSLVNMRATEQRYLEAFQALNQALNEPLVAAYARVEELEAERDELKLKLCQHQQPVGK